MSKLLLLVQSEADVAHLDAAAKAILNSSIKGVWVVFSPAITVNTSEAAAKIAAEIEQLETAYQQACARKDIKAAEGYLLQQNGKQLDRQKLINDSWKAIPPEERNKNTQRIIQPFKDQLEPKGLAVKVTGHSEHFEREQWLTMIQSLTGVWFKELVLGKFMTGWPEAVETSLGLLSPRAALTPTSKPPIAVTPTEEQKREFQEKIVNPARQKQLENMHGLKRRNIAKGLGIDVEGKDASEIIGLILAAESGKKAAEAVEPELAEY